MKKLISIIAGLLMLALPVSAATSIFNSNQIATSTPTSGYVPVSAGANLPAVWTANTGGGGSSFSTNPFQATYFVGTSTSATSTIPNLGGTLDASAFPGVDIGEKIDAAYAALPPKGGRITVPNGTYMYTTPIVFGTANKIVTLYCGSGGGASNNAVGGTTLDYTPSTGDAITVNTNNFIVAGAGIENCDIIGTNGTSARTTNGITLGGTNGAFSFTLTNVNISGFGTGYHLYQNTSFDTIINSTLHFNGRNIFIESTSGANGENFKMIGGVVADSNNQAGGATELYCINNQLSGNTQVSFIGTSIDDCQYYANQSGGTANETTFTNVHWENPAQDTYDYISTLSNVPATEISLLGGDMMNDVIGGMPEFITSGGDVSLSGVTINSNSTVTTAVTKLVNNLNASSTVSWSGLTNNGKGATYIYGTIPFSPNGYGNGSTGPAFNIAYPTTNNNSGTTTISNLGGVLDATTFPGADIGAKINAAYASVGSKGITINVPRGIYSFSTPIVFGVDGKRALLQGSPAEGSELDYTGTGAAITINDGIQGVGVDHTSGNGLRDLYVRGSNYSTTSPQIGVLVGGSNGTDGAVLSGVNIFHFGYGLQTAANAYHFMYMNGTIRDNGQNVHMNAASNSGESMDFVNAFIVDGANKQATDCFWMDNSATASLAYTGGSLDDCQMHILQANNVTITGTHFENPGSRTGGWPSYTPIVVDNNLATNVDINGATFFDTSGNGFVPPNYISNGGNVTLNGVIVRQFSGSTMTNLMALTGSGRVSWIGLNNVSGTAFTNVVSGYPYITNGTTGTTQIASLNLVGTLTDTSGSVGTSGQVLSSTGTGTSWITSAAGGGSGGGFTFGSGFIYNSTSTDRVGIGSTTPLSTLSVSGKGGTNPFTIASSTGSVMLQLLQNGYFGNTATPGFSLDLRNSGQAGASTGPNDIGLLNTEAGGSTGGAGIQGHTGIVPVAAGDRLGFTVYGYSDGTTNRNATNVAGYADQAWTAGTNQGSYLTFETTADNTATRSERVRIGANGNVGIASSTPLSTLSVQFVNGTDPFTIASSTGGNLFGFDKSGHRFTGGVAPIISSCGTGSPTVIGDDNAGVITTGTAATACTATFSQTWTNAPICVVTDNSLVGFADISSVSTSAVTFGISSALSGGNLYYSCSMHK